MTSQAAPFSVRLHQEDWRFLENLDEQILCQPLRVVNNASPNRRST